MHRTPLHQYHVDHGGRMVDFAGWDMPVMYAPDGKGSVHAEHTRVRTGGGVFDVSHMGRVHIEGAGATKLLETLCSRLIGTMQQGQCRYSLVLNERGGVRDDVIVMRRDEEVYTVVVNASNREKLLGHFADVAEKAGVNPTIDDRTFDTAMVAIQGPKVMELIGAVSQEIPAMKRYRFLEKDLGIAKVTVSRTGYTGEDGVEVIVPAGIVNIAMGMLQSKAGEVGDEFGPAGLAARDTLRLEAGMPLYGNELNEDVSALASGLDFAIAIDKADDERGGAFIGMEALRAERDAGGPPRTLVGLTLEGKRTARPGMSVTNGDAEVGAVTSGCLSPTLGSSIAMAYVDRASAEAGTRVRIDLGRAQAEATVSPLPFYKAPKK